MAVEVTPPTKMSKLELKNALLALGYTEDQLVDENGKGLKRPLLLEMIKDHEKGEEGLAVLDSVEENENDVGVEVSQDTQELQEDPGESEDQPEELDPPTPSDPGWTQYVIGKFLEDEVDGKNPRVEGLRRVAGELVGELIEEGCDLVAAPTELNQFRACVKAWGVFITPGGQQKRFEALADAHSDNCFEDYATYLVAMADTRAKGRMYRNALCLRRVVAAEEVSKTMSAAMDVQKGGAIHTGQISMIRMMADRHGFDIAEVLDNLCIQYKLNESTGDVNLQTLTYDDALTAAKSMRELKEAKEKEAKEKE